MYSLTVVAMLVSIFGYIASTEEAQAQFLNPPRAPWDWQSMLTQQNSKSITKNNEIDNQEPAADQEWFRHFKKSFVKPCVYNMGNCITSTQQERLLKHMRSLAALRPTY